MKDTLTQVPEVAAKANTQNPNPKLLLKTSSARNYT